MKAMASELNMYQSQVNEFKYEIEKLTRELQEMKRKYYTSKRKDQIAAELEATNQEAFTMTKSAPQALQQEQIGAAKNARSRFTGGGFAVK
jgi:predicted RNase H-like nuclease (RuvC/YqgF family)